MVVALEVAAVPLLEGALDLVHGNTPGGGRTNLAYFSEGVEAAGGLDARHVQLLYDPQTSGGLLVAIAGSAVPAALAALSKAGVAAHQVGVIEPKTPATFAVTLR
jgi:selenide,water dikinase